MSPTFYRAKLVLSYFFVGIEKIESKDICKFFGHLYNSIQYNKKGIYKKYRMVSYDKTATCFLKKITITKRHEGYIYKYRSGFERSI